MSNLYQKLINYAKSDCYPFHMPGHKRMINDGMSPYLYDITEIDGFDNLHEPEAVIKEEMEEAARFYQSKATYFLVNGSTCGLLSAICALTSKGEKILVARNCHKSVYHAIFLNELFPIYLYPEYIEEFGINGGISPQKVKDMMEQNKDIHVVVITSPTYEGIVSDLEEIAGIVHEKGGMLIVDEAHGAHFGMQKSFPLSALSCGADVVIQSVHKTLPALTQSALLHVKGDKVDCNRIEKYLHIFQTSSPSYVLLAGITNCIKIARESMQNGYFDQYAKRLDDFYQKVSAFQNIRIMQSNIVGKSAVKHFDQSKIVISSRNMNMTAQRIYEILRDDDHLQLEMCSGDYMIAMTSLMDTAEGFERLYQALKRIDESDRNHVYHKEINWDTNSHEEPFCFRIPQAKVQKRISDAYGDIKMIRLTDAKSKISAEYIYLYPPGIPIAAPGEMITEEIIALIMQYRKAGLTVYGIEGNNAEYVKVLGQE